jgi:GT2 family glycosyltransferase
MALRALGFRDVPPAAQESRQAPPAATSRGTPAAGTPAVDTPSATERGTVATLPRYALLLNPDTVVPPGALAAMVQFMDARPAVGVAGPRVRRPDGSLDKACRRSFPTPQVSFYRMAGLSRLFPHSRRFNAYNLEYLPEDAVHPVDSVVGAYMQVRREAILQAGLLDESFFMYGEDLDWAKRIKDAGWEVWYNGPVEILHVKEAASSQSVKSRIDFYEAMWLFYQKHYRADTNWLLDKTILLGIVGKGGLDVSRHLWRTCRSDTHGALKPAAGAKPLDATEDKTEEGRSSLNARESL